MKNAYKVIDAHCDTIGEIYTSCELAKSKGQLDIERMSEYGAWLQVFAVWEDVKKGENVQRQRHDEIIRRFYAEMQANKDKITHITDGSMIEGAWDDGKIAALLGIEGGDWIKSEKDIEYIYDKGVRILTLTWNYANHMACGVGTENESKGLSELGKNALRKMNELGILADVSHINESSFWDVIECTTMPISATHSNSKTICPHRRNLTDAQFEAICKNGGVVGINYYPSFVGTCKRIGIDDIIKHIEHFCALGGENNIGLGGDFDGVDALPRDLRGVQDVYRLLDRLLALNYSEQLVEKLAYKNFLRLFKKVIK